MRIISFLLLVFLVIVSCNSRENVAKRLIKTYVLEDLNDPKSYDPVEFGKIDSFFVPFEMAYETDIEEAKYLIKELNKKKEDIASMGIYNESREEAEREVEQIGGEVSNKILLLEEKEKNHVPFFYCYKVRHSYRAKNRFGATILNESYFYIDSTFTHIIRREDTENTNDDQVFVP